MYLWWYSLLSTSRENSFLRVPHNFQLYCRVCPFCGISMFLRNFSKLGTGEWFFSLNPGLQSFLTKLLVCCLNQLTTSAVSRTVKKYSHHWVMKHSQIGNQWLLSILVHRMTDVFVFWIIQKVLNKGYVKLGKYYPLASIVLPLQTLSVTSLKLIASSRPTAPPSSLAKCLRFGHWLTLCTLNMHLLTKFFCSEPWNWQNWLAEFGEICFQKLVPKYE